VFQEFFIVVQFVLMRLSVIRLADVLIFCYVFFALFVLFM